MNEQHAHSNNGDMARHVPDPGPEPNAVDHVVAGVDRACRAAWMDDDDVSIVIGASRRGKTTALLMPLFIPREG